MLIVSLIFLMVLTLIGVTAMQGTTLEERMARNTYDGERAFQAAEAAIREGEGWVMGINPYDAPTPVSSCSSAPCDLWEQKAFGYYPERQDATWWSNNARPYSHTISGLAQNPSFLVEYEAYDPGVTVIDANERSQRIGPHFYRVTAAGFGASTSTERVIQTTVRIWKN